MLHVLLALTLPLLASVLPAAAKPRVPIGIDPGGVAVAIIGPGVDYTRPEIAARLARDGEGEIIGWDFRDRDRAPYEAPVNGAPGPGTATANLLLAEARGARLALLAPTLEPVSLGKAAFFLTRSPVRIGLVAIATADANDWKHFAEVARRSPQLLFIVAAGDDGADLDQTPRFPASLGLDGVLVVTASDAAGRPAGGANTGGRTVDVAVPTSHAGDAAKLPPSIAAAGRVAALAARLSAADPGLAGTALKARILGLAQPLSGSGTKAGLIVDPGR